jgi:hypothetical protein
MKLGVILSEAKDLARRHREWGRREFLRCAQDDNAGGLLPP